MSRRDILRVGALGGAWLALPQWLWASASTKEANETPASPIHPAFGRAKRCIVLFLTGGPPQHDTWDPKPLASANVRGELAPIDTCVAGVQVSELFPLLAQRADKYTIVRSVTHGDTVHTTAG